MQLSLNGGFGGSGGFHIRRPEPDAALQDSGSSKPQSEAGAATQAAPDRQVHRGGGHHRRPHADPAPAAAPPAADSFVPATQDASSAGTTAVAPSEQLKVKSRTETTNSDLQFQVKTAEGDTVTLSVNAVQQSTSDKLSYAGPDGSLKVGQKTQSSSINASISVDGNLSDAELADISKALDALSQGKTLDNLGTLTSASFQFKSRTIYSQNQLSVLA